MEIKINPNWSATGYVKQEGTYAAYQVGNPTPSSFWFFSSKQFFVNQKLRITQGTNVSICEVVEVYSSFILSWNVIVRRIQGSPNLQTITQIDLVEDDQEFYLDGTIDLALNLRILDLKELKRSSPFTKTIEVPFTENNNKIFSQIFNVNVSEGFNPKKKSDCVITDGGVLISSGYLQVQTIDLPNKLYKCIFYGENKNLFDDIGDKYIFGNRDATEDINLDNLIHNKLKVDMDKAWSGTQDYGYGLFTTTTDVYTLDYMKGQSYHIGVEPQKWKPLIRAKAVFDAIFSKWGYTYESDFISLDLRFKDMFVLPSIEPPLGEVILKYSQTDPPTPWTITAGVDNTIPLYVQTKDDWGNKYDYGTNRFLVPYTDTWRVGLELSIQPRSTVWFGGTTASAAQRDANIDTGEIGVKIYRRGVLIDRQIIIPIAGRPRFQPPRPGGGPQGQGASPANYGYDPIGFQRIVITSLLLNNRINQGDELEFFVKITRSQFATYNVIGKYGANDAVDSISLQNDAITTNVVSLFNGIKQSDFIGDMFKMFNLYIKPDKQNPRKFLIEPRDDFYRKGKVISNLEYDVNSVEISYLNDLAAKKYIFSYAKGEDEFNKSFSQKNRDRVYGDAIITLDNDFLTNEKKITLSGTPTMVGVADATNNIFLPNLKGAPVKDKMRYFYYGGMIQTNQVFKYLLYQTNITDAAIFTYSTYPGWSMFKVFNEPTSDSLVFAENSSGDKELSLYYNYYENEIETYAEPGSHILSLDVKMNTKVFSSIDYNDIYYFEVNGNPQYYILLSIENYKPDQTEMVKMKFMTYYDFRSNKPKRSRPVWDIPATGIGDIGNTNPRSGIDLRPIDGGGVGSGNGGIKWGGVGSINGGVYAGEDIAAAGNNKNILVVGDRITIGEGKKNIFAFGEDVGLINADNIITFGGKGKTFSNPNTFNLNDLNMVLGKTSGTGSTPESGMMVYTGDAIKVYTEAGTWSSISLTQSGTGDVNVYKSWTYSTTAISEFSTASTYYTIMSVIPDQTGDGTLSYQAVISAGSSGDGGSDLSIRIKNSTTTLNDISINLDGGKQIMLSNTIPISFVVGEEIKFEAQNNTQGFKCYSGANLSVIRLK